MKISKGRNQKPSVTKSKPISKSDVLASGSATSSSPTSSSSTSAGVVSSTSSYAAVQAQAPTSQTPGSAGLAPRTMVRGRRGLAKADLVSIPDLATNGLPGSGAGSSVLDSLPGAPPENGSSWTGGLPGGSLPGNKEEPNGSIPGSESWPGASSTGTQGLPGGPATGGRNFNGMGHPGFGGGFGRERPTVGGQQLPGFEGRDGGGNLPGLEGVYSDSDSLRNDPRFQGPSVSVEFAENRDETEEDSKKIDKELKEEKESLKQRREAEKNWQGPPAPEKPKPKPYMPPRMEAEIEEDNEPGPRAPSGGGEVLPAQDPEWGGSGGATPDGTVVVGGAVVGPGTGPSVILETGEEDNEGATVGTGLGQIDPSILGGIGIGSEILVAEGTVASPSPVDLQIPGLVPVLDTVADPPQSGVQSSGSSFAGAQNLNIQGVGGQNLNIQGIGG